MFGPRFDGSVRIHNVRGSRLIDTDRRSPAPLWSARNRWRWFWRRVPDPAVAASDHRRCEVWACRIGRLRGRRRGLVLRLPCGAISMKSSSSKIVSIDAVSAGQLASVAECACGSRVLSCGSGNGSSRSDRMSVCICCCLIEKIRLDIRAPCELDRRFFFPVKAARVSVSSVALATATSVGRSKSGSGGSSASVSDFQIRRRERGDFFCGE